MKTKLIHSIVSFVLLIVLVGGTVGVNIVHYCCAPCENDGISGVLNETCGERHSSADTPSSCCANHNHNSHSKEMAGAALNLLTYKITSAECSISHLQLLIENSLNDFSYDAILSYTLLPVESLFLTFEKNAFQPISCHSIIYRGRDILVRNSVFLI